MNNDIINMEDNNNNIPNVNSVITEVSVCVTASRMQ